MSTGPIIKGEDRPHGFARGPFSKTTPAAAGVRDMATELLSRRAAEQQEPIRWPFYSITEAGRTALEANHG